MLFRKVAICIYCSLFLQGLFAATPEAPVLSLTTSGKTVSASWTEMDTANGYRLYFSPYPSGLPERSVDLGSKTAVNVRLPSGAAFYVHIKSYNDDGLSESSNEDHFIIGQTIDPWQSCLTGLDFEGLEDGLGNYPDELRIKDKWQRDITDVGITLVDWEGFIMNPESSFIIEAPSNTQYPVSFSIKAPNAPRLFLFQYIKKYAAENPWSVDHTFSLQNSDGPYWGTKVRTLDKFVEHEGWEPDPRTVYGGIDHDLSDAELTGMGLKREVFSFYEDDFPLELRLGIHPDREAGDEEYSLEIVMTDSANKESFKEVPVYVCDQDREERSTEFTFHIDYSTDYLGYLEETEDGQATKTYGERALADIAYFLKNKTFDTVQPGVCEVFVNWQVDEYPGTASNSVAYDNGFYIFLNSHSGGGSLPGYYQARQDGEVSDYLPCGFWGQDIRDRFNTNVNTRIYAQEDDWWETGGQYNFGRDGECLGDTIGEPGHGCIECPEGQQWCSYRRRDGYWPNTHELTHGLVYGSWPKWVQWWGSDNRCIEDEILMLYIGHCLPIHQDNHPNENHEHIYSKSSEFGRNLFRRFDFLAMQGVGWDLRETTAFVGLHIESSGLKVGAAGSYYKQVIDISGGVPGYRFSIIGGELPPGLSLNSFNGTISGKASAAGSYTFEVFVNDSDVDNVLMRNGVSKYLSIEIQ